MYIGEGRSNSGTHTHLNWWATLVKYVIFPSFKENAQHCFSHLCLFALVFLVPLLLCVSKPKLYLPIEVCGRYNSLQSTADWRPPVPFGGSQLTFCFGGRQLTFSKGPCLASQAAWYRMEKRAETHKWEKIG